MNRGPPPRVVAVVYSLDGVKQDVAIFDFATRTWSRETYDHPTPLFPTDGTQLPDGTVILIDARNPDLTTFHFTPGDGNKIIRLPTQPAKNLLAAMLTLADGRVLCLTNEQRHPVASYCDPATLQWSTVELVSRDYPFCPAAVALDNGTVFLCGGLRTGRTKSKSCYVFDPATGEYTPRADMIKARWTNAAVLLPDGKVLVSGGIVDEPAIKHCDECYARTASCEVYDTEKDEWYQGIVPDMNHRRSQHKMLYLPTIRTIFVIGIACSSHNAGPGTQCESLCLDESPLSWRIEQTFPNSLFERTAVGVGAPYNPNN